MTRTDIHRPGAIIPADYEHVLEYGRIWHVSAAQSMDGEADDEWENMDEAVGLYRTYGVFIHGTPPDVEDAILRCDLCGARYKFGSLFRHRATEEIISVGHDCAREMGLAIDEGEALRIRNRAADVRKARLERRRRFIGLLGWARINRALLPALATDHRIVQDIRARLVSTGARWGLSPKQEALVRKLHAESLKPREEETLVPAPITNARQTIEGRIVSVKMHEGAYGDSWKMTVKVEADGGVWLAWGACPSALFDAVRDLTGSGEGYCDALRGRRVRFDAALRAGRDAHFALFKRPTKAELLDLGPSAALLAEREAEARHDDEGLNYPTLNPLAAGARLDHYLWAAHPWWTEDTALAALGGAS